MTSKIKCYHTHPKVPLDAAVKGELYGGNGFAPCHKADLYVDLNPRQGIQAHRTYDTKDGGKYINFPIPNMGVPNLKKLHKLVDTLVTALEAGEVVHVGCIGGHGRTGLVLAVLVKKLTGNVNAVHWLRDNYCNRAVESAQQIDYLYDHFGISKVNPVYGNRVNWIGEL
ncbi:protein-tyrosine phosphatase family protein (plasmid) [Halobacteriovorax sp. GFR7]|uniref:protein-tyrosine phosphatase family protein n=1 Tax=unclassified Halobacteriovorax TaxID=2639665 RepID=UPI003D990C6D